jgi:hypothetical protein
MIRNATAITSNVEVIGDSHYMGQIYAALGFFMSALSLPS